MKDQGSERLIINILCVVNIVIIDTLYTDVFKQENLHKRFFFFWGGGSVCTFGRAWLISTILFSSFHPILKKTFLLNILF